MKSRTDQSKFSPPVYKTPYFFEVRINLVDPVLSEAITRSTFNHLGVIRSG